MTIAGKKPSVQDAVARANWLARKEQGFAGLPGHGAGKHHTRDYDAAKGRGGKPPKHKQDWSADRYAEEPTLTQPLMTRPDYGTVGESKMASSDLRSKLIRLAHANPALRAEILPLLAPGVDVRLASLRVKLSHKPQLEREGLDSTAAKQGMGAMLYFIDSAKNHSKYYEMIIKPEGGMFTLKKRWGALTDRGDTGRGDEKVEMFPSLAKAQAVLAKTYREKTGKGYKDAFNRMMHVSPASGETLPLGQYPVGLTRTVGFGWGTQSATKCIPSLRDLQEKIDGALGTILEVKEADHSDLADILADLQAADRIISGLMRNRDAVDGANQSMGDILAKMLATPMGRIQGLMGMARTQMGRPPVLDRQNLREELVAIRNYIRKQLSHCA
jgi:predicted DNA-binding WGR domain protein